MQVNKWQIYLCLHVLLMYMELGGNESHLKRLENNLAVVISAVQEEGHCCCHCFLYLFELPKSKTYYCYVNGQLLNNQFKISP